jgi:hypothetical protein
MVIVDSSCISSSKPGDSRASSQEPGRRSQNHQWRISKRDRTFSATTLLRRVISDSISSVATAPKSSSRASSEPSRREVITNNTTSSSAQRSASEPRSSRHAELSWSGPPSTTDPGSQVVASAETALFRGKEQSPAPDGNDEIDSMGFSQAMNSEADRQSSHTVQVGQEPSSIGLCGTEVVTPGNSLGKSLFHLDLQKHMF